jgi:hypothetical protein
VTDIKLDSKVLADVSAALEPYADQMFKQRAGRWMAVIELAHAERTDERLRQAQQDMYRRRTAAGTLDEVGTYRADNLLRNGVGLHVDDAA